ncbi:hypothetical protein HMPREF3115_14515 [Burkholderia sp. HMSC10F09]|nr:hypothetical protein HMPREF3115_14515 [Burkholderia sp. HMSC10F09]
MAAISSAATMNIHARLRPVRRPVTICGSAAGSRIRRNSASGRRRYSAPSSISLRSTLRIPATTAR